jgi:hypothetical protein
VNAVEAQCYDLHDQLRNDLMVDIARAIACVCVCFRPLQPAKSARSSVLSVLILFLSQQSQAMHIHRASLLRVAYTMSSLPIHAKLTAHLMYHHHSSLRDVEKKPISAVSRSHGAPEMCQSQTPTERLPSKRIHCRLQHLVEPELSKPF